MTPDLIHALEISAIRSACNRLPGAPNLEGDIKRLEHVRWEAETLRARAKEIESRAAVRLIESLDSEWTRKEIEAAFQPAIIGRH